MVPRQSGWRTARHVAPVPQPPRPDATLSAPVPHRQVAPTGRRLPMQNLGDSAKWSISFVAILAYVYSAVTYGLPLVAPAVVVALIGLFFERIRIVFPGFLILFALWIVWAAVGMGSSYQSEETVKQVTVLLKVFIIVFAIVNVVHNAWRARMFIIFFLGCFALYPARGTIVNYFIVRYTLFGRALWNFIYGNSNDLAALTFFPLSLTLALIFTEKKGWVKNVSFIGTGVLTLIILLTQSRGALIALVATGLIFFLTQARGKRLKSALIAAVVCVLILPLVPSSAWKRFEGLTKLTDTATIGDADPEGSADARYNIWRVARQIISENPATGIGLGAYQLAHATYTGRMVVPPAARGFRDTHSTYLNVAAETGIPGLILFMAMIGTVAGGAEVTRRRAAGTPRARQIFALQLGLLAFLMHGIFGSLSKLSFLYIQLAVIWVVTEVTRRELAASEASLPVRARRRG
jgi:putative inorganic carbon (hco3(-)) transporter